MAIRRPARLVAPLVLVLCVAAVLVVVSSTLSDDGAARSPAAATTATTATTAKRGPRTYRVRSGDTLGGISEKVDVPVDRILELNPRVDPQSLRAGERLKLRQ
jgi:LysM repeat protein